jgi:tetratricopeptide (TPR) repeat protein
VAVWALLVVAVLSKEQGLLLPLMLVALHALDRGRPRAFEPAPSLATSERTAMRALLVLICWTMAAYIVFRENILKFWWDRAFLDWTQNPMVRAHGADRLLMPIVLFGRYVQLLLFPHKLSIDYGGSVIGFHVQPNDPYLYIGIAAAVAWTVATIIALVRRNGPVLLCLLGFGMVYGLIGNIVTIIGTNFGERLMYLPSAFFLILVGIALARLPRRATVTLTTVILALACVRTYTYAARWNDRLAFMQSSARAQPRSVRVHLLLADELIRRKDYAKANDAMETARQVQPDYPKVWIQSAAVALLMGDVDRAERMAQHALDLDPSTGSSQIWTLIRERRAATQPTTTRPHL